MGLSKPICLTCGGTIHGEKCLLCEMFAEGSPPGLSGNTPSCWPLKMESLAVHPTQVIDAMERNKKHGLYVNYDRHGTPIVPDRRTRARLMAVENSNIQGGVRDNDGGYEECINTPKPEKPKKKLSQAFIEDGVRCNPEAMVKATRKKFFGKE